MPALPRHPVRGSATGRPIMAALDLLGRRWCLRILWELKDRPLTFRALQSACGGISPSVLQRRLTDLRTVRLSEHGIDGYALTARARELLPILLTLQDWSQLWAADLGNPPDDGDVSA